jgi:DNA recombination protein RmuC
MRQFENGEDSHFPEIIEGRLPVNVAPKIGVVAPLLCSAFDPQNESGSEAQAQAIRGSSTMAQWEDAIAWLAAMDPRIVLPVTGGFCALMLASIAFALFRQGAARERENALRTAEARTLEADLAEMKGRLAALAELSVAKQGDLARSVNERLDRVSQFVGANLDEAQRRTGENLSRLYERLASIDTAQKNLTELSSRVVSLQDILANKQTRGAFGQMRMETIIADGLPRDAYSFQATLSNGRRPDCLLRLPGSKAGIVIDAKFPLEAFEDLRKAQDEAAGKEAARRIRVDVGRHIDDIAARYLLPGETQDTAMMFVPAESVYADLHETFPDVIQKAHRARVVIVSPNMLMLAVQTMVAILKDARMREQADVIQREVGLLLEDVGRLRDRVLEFQKHYAQLGPDLERILVSSEKIAGRARRIEGLDLAEEGVAGVALSEQVLVSAD